jgi:hypothetical protein
MYELSLEYNLIWLSQPNMPYPTYSKLKVLSAERWNRECHYLGFWGFGVLGFWGHPEHYAQP